MERLVRGERILSEREHAIPVSDSVLFGPGRRDRCAVQTAASSSPPELQHGWALASPRSTCPFPLTSRAEAAPEQVQGWVRFPAAGQGRVLLSALGRSADLIESWQNPRRHSTAARVRVSRSTKLTFFFFFF